MAVNVSRDAAVAVVTMDRPEALNALDRHTLQHLGAVVDELAGDGSVRAVVLTGGGDKAFVAGADIAEMKDMSAAQAHEFSALGQGVMSGIEAAPQPWIAAVNGFALGGGCELALACDIRLASEKAKFGQPEVGLATTPGFGGTQRLPRCVGMGWASYLVLSGRHIRADEALRIGLVQAVYAPDELMPKALRLAADMCAHSVTALRHCKAELKAAAAVDLRSGQEVERHLFALTFAGPDQQEGMQAFLHRRDARFPGR